MCEGIKDCEALRAEIDADIKAKKAKLLAHIEASENFEDDDWKVTRVQAHSRSWNVEALQRIVGAKMWTLITKRVPDPVLIDEQVRAGKLDDKKIAKAYVETPGTAYVKVSPKKETPQGDATKLAEALS